MKYGLVRKGDGSSPHTRGARPLAGRVAWVPPDHPRIRGEHHPRRRGSPAAGGSSPHTRGALAPGTSETRQKRIIPAYAGSTDDGAGIVRVGRWIIPAYAGSTGLCNLGPEADPDHPRIRGEHVFPVPRAPVAMGSSPHTRGARCPSTRISSPARIIPAYAGSTASLGRYRVSPSDHPRIRGEHASAVPASIKVGGSSPHTRGARVDTVDVALTDRIIPAYAGSTLWRRR